LMVADTGWNEVSGAMERDETQQRQRDDQSQQIDRNRSHTLGSDFKCQRADGPAESGQDGEDVAGVCSEVPNHK